MAGKPSKRSTDTHPVEVDGVAWRFVVYGDGSYTLLDPDGRAVPPSDHLEPAQIREFLGLEPLPEVVPLGGASQG